MSGPLQIVHDRPVSEDDPQRAYHSLPPGLLLRPSQVPGGDLGVWATHAWPPGVRFGPYQGELVVVNSRGVSYHSWEIFKDKATYSVDAHDITKANWMRFVNYACSDREQNLAAFQYDGAIFYRTTKFIQPSQELLVWYGQDCDSLISLSATNEVISFATNEVDSCDKNSSHCDVVVLDDDGDCCNISTEFDCRICDDVVRWDSSVHSSNNIDTSVENRHIRTVPDDIERYLFGFNNPFDMVCGTNSSNVINNNNNNNNNNNITTNNNNNNNTNNNGINTPNILLNSFENGIGIVTNIIETELDVITVDDDCPTNQLSDAFELNADDIIYPCPFCPRAFERKISLNHHMKVHKRSSLFKCGLCEKTFKYENSLMHHHRLHTGVGQYKCSICFKTFIRDFHLQRHLESHQDKRGNTCILCSVSFPSAKLFARHIKNYHSIDRELNCQTCGKTFSVAKDLIQHKRKHHQPNYKCTICQKTYASSNALTGHMRAHSEERPYACHICNKTFKGNSSLAYHIRTHTGERPYKCVTCGAAFISNQLRRLHMSKCYARHKNTR